MIQNKIYLLLFIASYYRQLSVDVKMKNNEYGLVWLRTVSKPPDINRLRSNIGKSINFCNIIVILIEKKNLVIFKFDNVID